MLSRCGGSGTRGRDSRRAGRARVRTHSIGLDLEQLREYLASHQESFDDPATATQWAKLVCLYDYQDRPRCGRTLTATGHDFSNLAATRAPAEVLRCAGWLDFDKPDPDARAGFPVDSVRPRYDLEAYDALIGIVANSHAGL